VAYEHSLIMVIGLGVIYWMFNKGVKLIMATLADVKTSLQTLSDDVNAAIARDVGGVTAADLDTIKSTVDEIDTRVNTINTPPVA
jgi:hypothetical protein